MIFKPFLLILILLTLNPLFAQSNKAESLYQQGLIQNKQGKLIDASVLFTQAISEHKEYAVAYYQRGLSFNGMGKELQSIKDYKKAVDYKIQNIKPYILLINYYKKNSQYLAALIITDQIIANLPDQSLGGYYDKAQIYELMNKNDYAIKAYEECIEEIGDDMPEFKQQIVDKIKKLKTEGNNNG